MDEQINSRQYALKYGVILGLVGTLVWVLPAALRLSISILFLVYWAYFVGVFYLALSAFRKANGGIMSFGQGFGIVMLATLIGGAVRAVLRYAYLVFDGGYFEFALEAQQNSPFAQPESTEEAAGFMEAIFTPGGFAIMSFIGAIFAGLIFGAIVSAVMKNEAEEF
ncbi:DUF4199 domain-containing protein [Roseivirga sp.]|uniref:DUF4199 domain-containing protein n=1 Tax=Roseivirga sp. TaxID=1964215 RepID=UPI003B8CB14B